MGKPRTRIDWYTIGKLSVKDGFDSDKILADGQAKWKER